MPSSAWRAPTPSPDDVEVTDRAVLEATPPALLLPDRSQARAATLSGAVTVLDVLDLGHDTSGRQALVAVARIDGRDLIAPGVIEDGRFRRDPGVASLLRAGSHGAFEVELMGTGIPVADTVTLDVDQSNDSVIIGDAMVKWQIDAAPSPAPDRLRALVGSGATPDLRAIVTWQSPVGTTFTILTAARALPHAVDGWTWAVDLVRAHALGHEVDALTPFRRLGAMTAGMHSALAASGVSTWGDAEIARLRASCTESLHEVESTVTGDEGRRLRARGPRLQRVIDGLDDVHVTPVIDIHGDLHIGQVLSTPDTALAIVDFDGNPVLPPEDRAERQPAARDVAGMLASIDHVARVVNHRTPGLAPEPARAWIPLAQEAFLEAYRARLEEGGRADLLDDRLLPPLLVDQELREYLYALRFLPHWTYVPDAVLTDMFPDDETRLG